MRRIAEPHVLAIHEVVDSDGQLFLVMDYHAGGDLADRLARKRRLDGAEVRELAAQLCGALAAAHRAGVVHRDVKPSNVLCGPGAGLDVRLCDFGLARSGGFLRAHDRERGAGHARVHGPRGRDRRPRRSAQRHLQSGRRAVRGGDRAAAVLRRLALSIDAPAHRRRGATRAQPGARSAGGNRRRYRARSREGSAGSIRDGRGSGARAGGRFVSRHGGARARAGGQPRASRLPPLRRLGRGSRRGLRRLRSDAPAAGLRARRRLGDRHRSGRDGGQARCLATGGVVQDPGRASRRLGRSDRPPPSRAPGPVLCREGDHARIGKRADRAPARR